MYSKIKKIHFIGIGGIGMSSLAEILSQNGYEVTGSDIFANDNIEALKKRNIDIYIGHSQEYVKDKELIVYSSAIDKKNPELLEAQKLGIITIPRSEMLCEIMRLKYGISIAGSHGKTTTTAMIGFILHEACFDPSIVVGGRMIDLKDRHALIGHGEFIVVESDESDGSFTKLNSTIAVVSNIDREHLDHYQSFEALQQAFFQFCDKVPFYGLNVICIDDPYTFALSKKISRRLCTVGCHPLSDYRLLDFHSMELFSSSFVLSRSVFSRSNREYEIELLIPGIHNVKNALLAIATAEELGVPIVKSIEILKNFHGVARRFQKKGVLDGVLFIDDYAHHPSEIQATCTAIRKLALNMPLYGIFQPHRYSRVENLMKEFRDSLEPFDMLYVLPIYAAGENPKEGLTETFISYLQEQREGKVFFAPSAFQAVSDILSYHKRTTKCSIPSSQPSDTVQALSLTLGAGNINQVYSKIF